MCLVLSIREVVQFIESKYHKQNHHKKKPRTEKQNRREKFLMKKIRNISAIVLSMIFIFTAAACNNNNQPAATPTPPAAATPTATPGEQATPPATGLGQTGIIQYPIETDITLRWFQDSVGNVQTLVTGFGQTPFAIALSEQTGIDIEWVEPPLGQLAERFGNMIASNDLTDIIMINWHTQYQGAAAGAVADSIIIELTEPMTIWAPHYLQVMADHPEVARQVVTDDGNHVVFPFLRIDPLTKVFFGPMVRADWIEQLEIDIPETIDDWEIMLRRFRDEMGANSPFIGNATAEPEFIHSAFLTAYGVRIDFYIDNGEVRWGFMEDGYRDFARRMNQWFDEGLLSPTLFNIDRPTWDAGILGNNSGGTVGFAGSGMGVWLANTTDPDFDLVAVPFPVLNRGDISSHGFVSHDFASSPGHAGISTQAQSVEVAMRLLDFAYGPEGNILYNYGIEGVSFEWENDFPTYTDFIMRNPDGISISHILSAHTRAAHNGPFVQSPRYVVQFQATDQQRHALNVWAGQDRPEDTFMPPISMTPDETAELARIMSEITTFRQETISTFLANGFTDAQWDSYVESVVNMGINDAIAIFQAAYNRYLQR